MFKKEFILFSPVFSASHPLVQKRYNDTLCVVVQIIMTSFQIFLLGLDVVVKNALLKFNVSTSAVLFLAFIKIINIQFVSN